MIYTEGTADSHQKKYNDSRSEQNSAIPYMEFESNREVINHVEEGSILPFVGRISEFHPRSSIKVERRLTVTEDLHLADHAFVEAIGVKPVSGCLPVVPMTLCMEVMAETAACLAPGYGLIGFEDLRAARWVQLADTEWLQLIINANVVEFDSDDEFCRISVSIRVDDQKHVSVEGFLLFASRYRHSLEPKFTELVNPQVHPLRSEMFYKEKHLFHGPLYQRLTGEITLGEQGAVGTFSGKAPTGFFKSTQQPQFITDPSLLDAIGQLVGIWAMNRNRYAFPIGIKKLEFYKPTPPPGTLLPVRIEITRDDAIFIECNVEVQDGTGEVWLRIIGWKEWMFRLEKRLVDFRRLPRRYLIGIELHFKNHANKLAGYTISPSDIKGFDIDLLARYYLHMDEMQEYWEKRSNARRQLYWLLGRIVAKDAIRHWLAQRLETLEMLHPASILIRPNKLGQPHAILDDIENINVPHISISHCDEQAIALASNELVGVDVEAINTRYIGFYESITTHCERELFSDFVEKSSSDRDEWLTRLWCAKEAASKSLGLGLTKSPLSWEMRGLNAGGEVDIYSADHDSMIQVHTSKVNNFIIAIAITGSGGCLKPSTIKLEQVSNWL